MPKSDYGNSYLRHGAVWPMGRDLDQARRQPQLISRDASVILTQGPTGTDVQVAPWQYVWAELNSSTGDVYVYVHGWLAYAAGFKEWIRSYAFNLPTVADSSIQLLLLPWLQVSGTYASYYSVAWCQPALADTITGADADTAAAFVGTAFYDLLSGKRYGLVLANIAITTAGAVTVSNNRGILNPLLALPMRPVPLPLFNEQQHLGVQYDGSGSPNPVLYFRGTETGGAVSLAVPASTDDDIYLYGDPGGPLTSAAYTAVPASHWGILWGHITTDSSGRVLELLPERSSWWHHWPGEDNTGQGVTTTQEVVTAVNFGASTVTTKTLTFVNGICTSIA